MPTVQASFSRDANGVPITDAFATDNIVALSANNTTAATSIFKVTGTVEVLAIWGVLRATLGNHTAAHYRANDGTTQPVITAASGLTLSAKTPGSSFYKRGLAASALSLLDNAAVAVAEPAAAETMFHSPFVITQKASTDSFIEYVYTTTDTPATGTIHHYIKWKPLSTSGLVVKV